MTAVRVGSIVARISGVDLASTRSTALRTQQALAFVAIGEHLEEQFGAGPAERQIAQFVANEQIDVVQARQASVQGRLLMGLFQWLDRGRVGEVADTLSLPASGQTDCRGQMRLPVPALPMKQMVKCRSIHSPRARSGSLCLLTRDAVTSRVGDALERVGC